MWNQPRTTRAGARAKSGFAYGRLLQVLRCPRVGVVGIVMLGLLWGCSGPVGGQEPTDKPTTDKPTTDKPTTDKPTTDKPATDKPATEKPATDKPAAVPSSGAATTQDAAPTAPAADSEKKQEPPFQLPKSWRRVTKDYEVWIDFSKKQVIVGGHICLREGMLEMFACPEGTKEHEAIVAVHTAARFVHAALVAVGAKPGPPVQFTPTYRPAQGTEVTIEVLWKNAAGEEQRTRAQKWVKYVKSGEELKYPWVFAGSGFWTDEDGKEWYNADGGDFICVSNFSTATLDLPVESSAGNDTLMFSAFKDRIPPLNTPVLLILTPKLKEKAADAGKDSPKSDDKQVTEPTTEPKTKPAKEAATPAPSKEPAKEPAKDTSVERSAPKPAEQDAPAKSNREPSC